MKATKPGLTEGFIEGVIDLECRRMGAKRLAYPPVVAGGSNAITLHYITNDEVLRFVWLFGFWLSVGRDGDLLLVDAGGDLFDYSADITRTWPINGRYTKPQKEIYELVLFGFFVFLD